MTSAPELPLIAVPNAGRFAPSPSGDLHIGNLRTAVLAWLFARSSGRRFLLRMENLDRAIGGSDARQLADLNLLGIDWDPATAGSPVLHQTSRLDRYRHVVGELRAAGRTFDCFCTRREIRDAPSAPHTPPGAYPGTCRALTDAQRADRIAEGRPPAVRISTDVANFTVTDDLVGNYTGAVDDFVIQRGDGTPAYNLAVVVDDGEQGIDQVVRGDDLLSSAPRQAYLATLLGFSPPRYAHVPMVLNTEQVRLSKRDGAVTLADLAADGVDASTVLGWLAASLGMAAPGERIDSVTQLLDRFDPAALPREPWLVDPAGLTR